MNVLVTGATGYIGSAVVSALVSGGHRVTGLVRSRDKATSLEKLGVTPLVGDLAAPESFRATAAEHDACVHVGFHYGGDSVAIDRAAITTLLDAAATRSSPSLVVYTSGVLCLGNTGGSNEDTATNPISVVAWRPAHEELTLSAATERVATAVIRPGFVYGGAKGILAGYFDSAIRNGASSYVGDGTNRFALVHRDDLAALYRVVLERRGRGIFHGVDGAAPRIAALTRAASQSAGAGGTTRSIPIEQARELMGPYADALCTDQVVVATRSSEIGWRPAHAAPLGAMNDCFAEWTRATRSTP